MLGSPEGELLPVGAPRRMASPTVDRKLIPSGAKLRAAAALGVWLAVGKAQQRTHGSQGTSQARLTPGKAPPPTPELGPPPCPGLTCRLQPTAALSPARGTSRTTGGPRAPAAVGACPGPSACKHSHWDTFQAVLRTREKLSADDIRILLDDSCGGTQAGGPDRRRCQQGLLHEGGGMLVGMQALPITAQPKSRGRGRGHRLSPRQETTRTPSTRQRRALGRAAVSVWGPHSGVRAHPVGGMTGEGGVRRRDRTVATRQITGFSAVGAHLLRAGVKTLRRRVREKLRRELVGRGSPAGEHETPHRQACGAASISPSPSDNERTNHSPRPGLGAGGHGRPQSPPRKDEGPAHMGHARPGRAERRAPSGWAPWVRAAAEEPAERARPGLLRGEDVRPARPPAPALETIAVSVTSFQPPASRRCKASAHGSGTQKTSRGRGGHRASSQQHGPPKPPACADLGVRRPAPCRLRGGTRGTCRVPAPAHGAWPHSRKRSRAGRTSRKGGGCALEAYRGGSRTHLVFPTHPHFETI